MPSVLSEEASERSTYAVDVDFYDEDGTAVVPSAVTWTLTDEVGNVVNSREDVSVTAAASVTVVLSGLDLAIGGDLVGAWRRLLVKATYTSNLGSGLPLREEIRFKIADFAGLSGDS